ncbi:MAG: hypothetical protein ABSH56_29640 [Bryobacteraceae bacterium]|jgi:hypothetical protein
MQLFPARFPRLALTQGTSLAALTVISALGTFFVLNQPHSADLAEALPPGAAPSRPSPGGAAGDLMGPAPAEAMEPVSVAALSAAPSSTVDPLPAKPLPQTEPLEAALRLRPKGPLALIAEDDSSLQRMIADPKTLPRLIRDGRLFSASPGAKVEILEQRGGLVHVRLLDGATADRSGWVIRSAVSNPARR